VPVFNQGGVKNGRQKAVPLFNKQMTTKKKKQYLLDKQEQEFFFWKIIFKNMVLKIH
jgi:hypothetical protein